MNRNLVPDKITKISESCQSSKIIKLSDTILYKLFLSPGFYPISENILQHLSADDKNNLISLDLSTPFAQFNAKKLIKSDKNILAHLVERFFSNDAATSERNWKLVEFYGRIYKSMDYPIDGVINFLNTLYGFNLIGSYNTHDTYNTIYKKKCQLLRYLMLDLNHMKTSKNQTFRFNTSYSDENGNNLAHLAAIADNLDLMKYIPSTGVDMNKINDEDQTPLSQAIRSGKVEIVHYLNDDLQVDLYQRKRLFDSERPGEFVLEHNEQMLLIGFISYSDKNGNNLAHLFAMAGNLEFMKYCSNKGVDMNKVNDDDQTPLSYALRSGKEEMVQYLNDILKVNLYQRKSSNPGEYVLEHFETLKLLGFDKESVDLAKAKNSRKRKMSV